MRRLDDHRAPDDTDAGRDSAQKAPVGVSHTPGLTSAAPVGELRTPGGRFCIPSPSEHQAPAGFFRVRLRKASPVLNLADLKTADPAVEQPAEFTHAQKRAYTFLHLAGHPDWTPTEVILFAQADAAAFTAVFDLFIAGQLPNGG